MNKYSSPLRWALSVAYPASILHLSLPNNLFCVSTHLLVPSTHRQTEVELISSPTHLLVDPDSSKPIRAQHSYCGYCSPWCKGPHQIGKRDLQFVAEVPHFLLFLHLCLATIWWPFRKICLRKKPRKMAEPKDEMNSILCDVPDSPN